MSQPTISPDVTFLRRLIDLEQQVAALSRAGQLANAGVRTVAGPASQSQNKGIIIVDASGNERVRLGVTDSDASPAAAQSLYGLSAKDTNGKLRVLLGQTSSTPTYGLSTFDAAGVQRFTAGQIDGSTDGAAAYDASGNVIWDTTGLVGVAAIANQASFGSQTYTMTNDTSWHDVPNSTSGTFTLARSASILALGSLTSSNATGTSITDILYRLVVEDGSGTVLANSQTGYASTANGWYNMTQYILYAAAAGTFQIRWQYQQALSFGTTQGATVKALISSAVKFGG